MPKQRKMPLMTSLINHLALKLTEGGSRRSKHLCAYFLIRRHGFYFVDVPKTSSTSIRHDLGERFGLPYTKYLHTDPRVMLPCHMPAMQLIELLGKPVWDKPFTFTMVRNPWDRMYSWYNYYRGRKELHQQVDFRKFVLNANAESPVTRQNVDFFGGSLSHRCAADQICDKRGRILVDYVARYERREHDLERIRKRLNMKTLGGRSFNKSTPDGDHYSRHYDDETREIVRILHARDIELFGYEFEDKR